MGTPPGTQLKPTEAPGLVAGFPTADFGGGSAYFGGIGGSPPRFWNRCWILDVGSCIKDIHKLLVDILGFGGPWHSFCHKRLQEILLLLRELTLI